MLCAEPTLIDLDHAAADVPPALEVDGLSKCYRIYDHPRDRLLQGLWGERRRFYREFWALQPLSFRLARGTTLGVVGRNGSGKSSLLQLICGTLTPTTGSVRVHGRIGALLELGSGFSPEFTGRENVFLNAALLGLSKEETERRLEAILAFADIGAFVDQPVKTYSSGMVVRLAFAVQAHIDPELLVVDEALAVGDEMFQKKCFNRLENLKDRGCSILLVTHSCPQIIQYCDQALLLHKGVARLWGRPSNVTVMYQSLSNASDEEWDRALGSGQIVEQPDLPLSKAPAEANEPAGRPSSAVVYPASGVEITAVEILTERGDPGRVLPMGTGFVVCFSYRADRELEHLCFGCHISRHTGTRISGQILMPQQHGQGRFMAGQHWTIRFAFRGALWPGVYFIGGGIWAENASSRFLHRVTDYVSFKVPDAEGVNVAGMCNLASAEPSMAFEQPPHSP
jgi:lipopolysaccharide transport system ATP-binding protein